MNSEWEAWGGVVLATGTVLAGLVVVVLIWQIFKTWQAWLATRAEVARDKDYRGLAERAVNAEETLLDGQQRIVGELSEMRASIASMERLLREVE